METVKSAFLFPGQGAYVQGILPLLARNWASARDTFKKIDSTCHETGCARVSDVLDAPEPPDLETLVKSAPEQLQLILYGTSIAAFGLLREMQKQPLWLMGHSFGEISALVCAGAFSIEDGARIIHARNRALSALKQTDGAMIALKISAERADALVRLLDNPSVRVACYNAPRQCVLSGPKPAMQQAQELAIALGFGPTFVASPYAFHNPMLAPAVEQFAKAIRHLRQRSLEHPIYSPISGRLYDDRDILSDVIAGHLVRPVAFIDALRKAYAAGVDEFVECGAGAALVGLATRTLPSIRTYAPLSDTRTLETELTRLSAPVPASSVRTATPATAAPVVQANPPQIDLVVPVDRPVPVRPESRDQLPAAEATPGMTHTQIAAAVRDVCAALMGYPPEVFEEDADLEADLGIDSIKKTELELAILEQLKLPADTRGIMAGTFGELVATVAAAQQTQSAPVPASSARTATPATPAPVVQANPPQIDLVAPVDRPVIVSPKSRDQLPAAEATPGMTHTQIAAAVRDVCAELMGYPPEVFEEDADLEADLGIDSIKKTELELAILEQLKLPADTRGIMAGTFGELVATVAVAQQTQQGRAA